MTNEQEILEARARKAAGWKSVKPSGETLLVVEFLLTPELYSIQASCVVEVLPGKEITTIPGAPPFVLGVMNVRGKIVSVVNLKKFLNLKETGITSLNKVVLVRQGEMEFGIMVDHVTGIRSIQQQEISPPPATLHGTGAELLLGIHTDGLIIFNIQHILSNPSLIVNQK